jgi:hypothetical protein
VWTALAKSKPILARLDTDSQPTERAHGDGDSQSHRVFSAVTGSTRDCLRARSFFDPFGAPLFGSPF